MALNLRQRQTECITRMLNLNQPVNATGMANEEVYKILIYDKFCQNILSPTKRCTRSIFRFILQLVKYMVQGGEWQVLQRLIPNWSERRHCWNCQTLGSFKTTHPKWQHWIILSHWRAIFLSTHMTETWLKWLKAIAER